jgi:hypothetical protein
MRLVSRWNKKTAILACALACMLPAAPDAGSQARQNGNAPSIPRGTEIRATANPKLATVGDPIRVDLEITAPPDYRMEVQKPDNPERQFVIREFNPGPDLPGSGQTRTPVKANAPANHEIARHRARLVLAFYKTGKFTIPPIAVKLKNSEGKGISVFSPPVDIEIKTVLQAKDAALKDLKKQAEIPEPFRWLRWVILAIAACLLCGLAAYLWRKRRTPPELPPAIQPRDLLETAEADLRALIARGLPRTGDEMRFYIALSGITKKVLEAGYSIHTGELTTSEIKDALTRIREPKTVNRERIGSFLNRCDVVKFAKYIPQRDEHEAAGREALEILEEVKKAVSDRQLTAGSRHEG